MKVFYLALLVIFLWLGIDIGITLWKHRTRYNLGFFFICIALLTLSVVNLVAPQLVDSMEMALLRRVPGGQNMWLFLCILVATLVGLLIAMYAYYPDIKRFFARRKAKVK